MSSLARLILLSSNFASQAFKEFYESSGWLVSHSSQGFLTRQRTRDSAVLCVHGGSTATVVALLDGRWLISANVGDSSAILCGAGNNLRTKPIAEWTPLSGGDPNTGKNGALLASTTSRRTVDVDVGDYVLANSEAASCTEISADHSPENGAEFQRVQRVRAHKSKDGFPELSFVYDRLSASKLTCPDIFEYYQGTDGEAVLRKTGRGAYYKNVRNEWATLVATPESAPFQDALAFTRSLGDLHLQTYGVS